MASKSALWVEMFLSMLLLAGFTFSLLAEESSPPDMKLNKLIQQALDNNLDLKAAHKLWEAAKARIPQSKALDDPQIRVMWDGITGRNKSLHPNASTFRLSQTIPFPGKRDLKGKIAQTEADVAKAQYESKKREVISEVKRAYYTLFFAHKAVDNNQIHIGHLRQLEAVARTRFTVGTSPLSDVLSAQMELGRRLNNDITLQQELKVAAAKINTLLNRPLNSTVEIAAEIPRPKFNYQLETLQELALQNRSELQVAKLGVKRGKFAHDLAKKQYFPDFMPMADRMPMQNGSGEWMFMLTVNIPIFFKGKYDAGLEEAKAGIEASEAAYENLKNQLFLEIQDLSVKLQTDERTAELYRTTLIPQSEQGLEAARQAYETGRSDFPTVIDSLMALENARLEYYRALTLFQQHLADLERAVGTTL
jgi:outer membrane protein TolC